MKTDDPKLEKAREQLFERIKKYDEMMLTVFKNHLGCEQFLNELLSASSRRWKGRTCGGKIDIAKTLNLPEIEPSIWKALEAGTSFATRSPILPTKVRSLQRWLPSARPMSPRLRQSKQEVAKI